MCVIIEVLVYLLCGTTSLSNWFWCFETLWSSKGIVHQSVMWCYIPQEWRPTPQGHKSPKICMRYSVGFLNDTQVSDHRFQGPVHPTFLLYIMNNPIWLQSFKNIQLFLLSPVSSFTLNKYNILAFPSLVSKIQVSWGITPCPLVVRRFRKACNRLASTKIKVLWYTMQYRFHIISNVNCLNLKDAESNSLRKVGNN
jgi:hypothetical protein